MSPARRALITGVTGQDGAYLARLLLGKGYEVFGTFRRSSSPNFWRLHALGSGTDVQLVPIDLSDTSSLVEAIRIAKPDELYNLAAQSFVGTSFETPLSTAEVSGLSTTRLLEMRAPPQARHALLPGIDERDVRLKLGRAAVGDDADMSPLSPYGRGQGRTRHYITRQLPRRATGCMRRRASSSTTNRRAAA